MPISSHNWVSLPTRILSYSRGYDIQLKVNNPISTYYLYDNNNKKLLATAESEFSREMISEDGVVFKDAQTVVFSSDESAIIIREDISDALPAVRYILFEKQSSGLFKTYYLELPYIDLGNYIGNIEWPYITYIKNGNVGLYYKQSNKTKVIKLAAIKRLVQPTTLIAKSEDFDTKKYFENEDRVSFAAFVIID